MNRGIAILLLLCLRNYAVAASITPRSPSDTETEACTSGAGWQVRVSGEKQFTPEEMIQDLDTLVRTLEEVHPDLYYYTPKTEIVALRDALVRSLDEPQDERGFVQVVARLVAKFGDAHTSVSLALPSRKTYIDRGGLFFPLDIKQAPRGVLITQNNSDNPALAPGDRVLSINGISIDAFFAQLLNEVSGETVAFRTFEVERNFKSMLWIHDI